MFKIFSLHDVTYGSGLYIIIQPNAVFASDVGKFYNTIIVLFGLTPFRMFDCVTVLVQSSIIIILMYQVYYCYNFTKRKKVDFFKATYFTRFRSYFSQRLLL